MATEAPAPGRWLVKTEPAAFSWDDLVRAGEEPWSGVRNALAARHLRAMRPGDPVLVYHSVTGKAVVGVAAVVRAARADPSDPTGRWPCPDLRAVAPLPRPVPLTALRAEPALAGFALVRQARLSVMPVTPAEWAAILRMAGTPG